MFRALGLAIGDLADPRILGILLRSILITLLIFAGIGAALMWVLNGADPCGWLIDDSCPLGLSASGFGAFVLVALGLWFLFPAVAFGVVAAYMDRVVTAVEARHYAAALAGARPLGLLGGAWLGLKSSLRVLIYNLIALPFYLLLLVTGVGPLILFLFVNGLAFGHDLGEMVATRHVDRLTRTAWLATTRVERAMLGMAVTGLFVIPFVNLLAPILGAAAATHLYHARPVRIVTP